jgi:hypothetical protein
MTRPFSKVISAAALLLFTNILYGQSVLTGKIVDKTDGEPVAFAQVALLNPDSTTVTGATTDINGKFSLEAEKGTYLLKAVFLGYEKLYRTINLNKEQINLGKLIMMKSSEVLDEVVVEAEMVRKPIEADIEGLKVRPDQTLSNAGG